MNIIKLTKGLSFVGGQVEITSQCNGTFRGGILKIAFRKDGFSARLKWQADKRFTDENWLKRNWLSRFVSKNRPSWSWTVRERTMLTAIKEIYRLTIHQVIDAQVVRCNLHKINGIERVMFKTVSGEEGELLQAGDTSNLVVDENTVIDPRQQH